MKNGKIQDTFSIGRVLNLFVSCMNYIMWSWRFKKFGFRSKIQRPDMVTNACNMRIGKKVNIRKRARLECVSDPLTGDFGTIEIGDNTSIQFYFHCGAAKRVKIGENVLIAGRVYITDHDHVYDDVLLPARCNKSITSSEVIIENGAWLGEGVVVLKGVTIGERAVVGANSVVTKNVPPYSVVGGVPARVIKIFR